MKSNYRYFIDNKEVTRNELKSFIARNFCHSICSFGIKYPNYEEAERVIRRYQRITKQTRYIIGVTLEGSFQIMIKN